MENKLNIRGIVPTDVKIYYENCVPYLDYTGIATLSFGEVKIHIPKMGLKLYEINTVYNKEGSIITKASERFYVVNETSATFEILKRTMTKTEIEKELGYEIDIKD